MKKIASRKPTGFPPQEQVHDDAGPTNGATNKDEDNPSRSNSSNLEIANLTCAPTLQSKNNSSESSKSVSHHRLPSMPLESLGSWSALQTTNPQPHLPPLYSWKHALIPVHPSVKPFDPPQAHENLRFKERPGFQPTGSLLVAEADVCKPLPDTTPKLLETPTKSPTLSVQSPESSAENLSSVSSNSSNTTSSANILSPEHPGTWRRSTSYESSPSYSKRFTHSKSRSTVTPLDPKLAKSWRRSVTEGDLKEFSPVKGSKIRTTRPSPMIREQADHLPLRQSSHEVRTPKGDSGARINSKPTELLPEELNCAVFITNIPAEVTPSEIFDYIHSGAVQALHMYPANDRYKHQAAKLVFAKAESAVILVDQAKGPYHVYMGDGRLHIAYNRDGSRAYDGPETRILLIEGPEDLMTYEHWKEYFDKTCFYLLDRWSYRPCAQAGRMKIEFSFLSAGMAKACVEKIKADHMEEGEDGVSVAFGRDVCDAGYLEPWAAPK
ncbi:hypothetical protein DL98DRAFT_130427 [Cadophora sp. DSE1049]|nr:hypothetical protein DL98DRAFT_130427 [Cadophora sp. DSE1049]